jgi:hypothetical protein
MKRGTGVRAPHPSASATSKPSAGSIMAPELPKGFKWFLSLLGSYCAEYLLIGRCAVGYSRLFARHRRPEHLGRYKDPEELS